jgi:hypothetical protein
MIWNFFHNLANLFVRNPVYLLAFTATVKFSKTTSRTHICARAKTSRSSTAIWAFFYVFSTVLSFFFYIFRSWSYPSRMCFKKIYKKVPFFKKNSINEKNSWERVPTTYSSCMCMYCTYFKPGLNESSKIRITPKSANQSSVISCSFGLSIPAPVQETPLRI